MESPFGAFPKSWRYKLAPASEVYHQVEERHPLAVTVASAIVFFSILLIGGIICDLLGWPT